MPTPQTTPTIHRVFRRANSLGEAVRRTGNADGRRISDRKGALATTGGRGGQESLRHPTRHGGDGDTPQRRRHGHQVTATRRLATPDTSPPAPTRHGRVRPARDKGRRPAGKNDRRGRHDGTFPGATRQEPGRPHRKRRTATHREMRYPLSATLPPRLRKGRRCQGGGRAATVGRRQSPRTPRETGNEASDDGGNGELEQP